MEGRIVAIDEKIVIALHRPSACHNCSKCLNEHLITVDKEQSYLKYKVGDKVQLLIKKRVVILLSLLFFIFPSAIILLLLTIGQYFYFLSIFLIFLFLISYFLMISLFLKKRSFRTIVSLQDFTI